MKKVFLIALTIVLSLGIIFLATGLIITKGKNISIFAKEERIEKRVDETRIATTLKLSVISDNLELHSSEDDMLHIVYWESDITPYEYSFAGGIAELKQQSNVNSWFSSFRRLPKSVIVYIPESVTELLSLRMTSGSLESKNYLCNVETLTINVTSGDVSIEGCAAESLDVHVTSGKIDFKDILTNKFSVNMSSGDFFLSNSSISQEFNLELTSGDVSIKNCDINVFKSIMTSGSMNANSVSASDIDCRTTSGEITLKLNGLASDYAIEIDLTSGEALLDIAGQTMKSQGNLSWGNGPQNIYCKSTSGKVNIYFSN